MSTEEALTCRFCGHVNPPPDDEDDDIEPACRNCGRKLSGEHPGGMTIAGGFHIRSMVPERPKPGQTGTPEAQPRAAAQAKAPVQPPPKPGAPPASMPKPAAPPPPAEEEEDEPKPVPRQIPERQKPNLRFRREADQEEVTGPWMVKFVKKSIFGSKERVEGPFTWDELICLVKDNQVHPETEIRRQDLDDWVRAQSQKALFTPAIMQVRERNKKKR